MLKEATDNILDRFKKITPKFDKVLTYIQKSYNIFVEKVQSDSIKKMKSLEQELAKSTKEIDAFQKQKSKYDEQIFDLKHQLEVHINLNTDLNLKL